MKSRSHLVNTLTALFIVWAGHFLVDIMIGFWAVYKTLAHLDLAVAGLIAGVSPFIGEGMQVIFGSLGDRGYRKALLIFGIGACSSATLLSFTENYYLLFLIYLVTCIGSGAFHPTAVAVTSSMTVNRKGLFVTIFASGGAIGLALSQVIFTSFYNFDKTALPYLTVPVFLLMAFILFVELPGAPHSPALKGRSYGFSAMKKLFLCRDLVMLYLCQVCSQSIVWAILFLLPDVLSTKGYDPWISFGVGHMCFILGGAMMMVPGGILSDKYSPKLVLLSSSMVGAILFYAFLMAPLLPDSWILFLLFCLGACLGIASPVAVAFGNKMMPSRPGLVSAFLMGLVWCIAESVGPGGGGLLTKCFVENAPTKALSCFGVMFIAGMTTTLLLPDKVTKEIQIDAA